MPTQIRFYRIYGLSNGFFILGTKKTHITPTKSTMNEIYSFNIKYMQ